jgi:antitoxin component YwqK of YwqJK toxin-antitoxin module
MATFMRTFTSWLILLAIALTSQSCQPAGKSGSEAELSEKEAEASGREEMVQRRREDGTLSSVSPVDSEGFVHGVKVNYYEDGRTIHSRVTYEHGRKHGPAIWYYRSGQVYEHTAFHYGRKEGLTKRYYESGQLMEQVTYHRGEEQPDKKRYRRDGTLMEG